MNSRLIISVAVSAIGTAFVGYCIYFDRKRRSDPQFKEKLRERRLKAKKVKDASQTAEMKGRMPDRNDQAAMQKFFFDEIQKGEELLAAGEFEKSVTHLTNAIAISGQPQQLLQVFQQTLPPDVFKMLMTNLSSGLPPQKTGATDGDSLD